MGDLIHKLPTDEIVISGEDKESLLLLFGAKEEKQELPKTEPDTEVVDAAPTVILPRSGELAREGVLILTYILCFFIVSLQWVDDLLQVYIPLCKNSWIVRHLVKAVLFALILWIVVNRVYLMSSA